LTDAQVERVIVATLKTVPDARPYWSARALAEQVGTSPSSVGRIWEAFGLQPRLVEAWKRQRAEHPSDPRDLRHLYRSDGSPLAAEPSTRPAAFRHRRQSSMVAGTGVARLGVALQ
jgi:hypothetical protein